MGLISGAEAQCLGDLDSRLLVALPPARNLLLCAKDLFVAAIVDNFALPRRDPHGTPLPVVVANIVVGDAT